jgi:hypothetical protein
MVAWIMFYFNFKKKIGPFQMPYFAYMFIKHLKKNYNFLFTMLYFPYFLMCA